MPNFKKSSWQNALRMTSWRVAQAKNPKTPRILASLLRGLAAEVEEKLDKTQTLLLEEYPYIPIRFFASHIGVSYSVGAKLYKKWHLEHKKPIPRHGKMDAGECKQWAERLVTNIMERSTK